VVAVFRQSSESQVSFEFLISGFLAHLYEEPLTLVVAPDLEQATPLLTFGAAFAGTAVSEAATSVAAPATRRTLRNMKTSIDYGAILPMVGV
jgi:hypothetical protein